MSCVVGIVDNEAVWMAADSLNSIEGVEGWCTASSNPKIIRKDDVLIGYVGSVRCKRCCNSLEDRIWLTFCLRNLASMIA